jgi:hypothetical protein
MKQSISHFIVLFFSALILAVIATPTLTQGNSRFSLMLESGAVWQHRNDAEIPPGTGTLLAFDEFSKGPFFHYRLEPVVRLTGSHFLRGVYAPFAVKVQGKPYRDIVFNGETFSQSEELEVSYKFNSYRLTYYYAFWGDGDSQLNGGITVKVRDAEIRYSQGAKVATNDNVGFVPLLYFEWLKPLSSTWAFHLQTDFAGASQGRAVDIALKARWDLSKATQLGFGYRTLEGGADNEKVKTFSWFNYAVADLVYNF